MSLKDAWSRAMRSAGPSELIIGIGSIALLIEMAVVFVTAIVRNAGMTFPGSIEIVGVVIVVIASTALVVTTLGAAHATIRLAVDRAGTVLGQRLYRLAHVLGALFWLLLAAGSLWILVDTAGEDEATMLVGIPLAPFRVIWLTACITIAIVLTWRAIAGFAGRHDS